MDRRTFLDGRGGGRRPSIGAACVGAETRQDPQHHRAVRRRRHRRQQLEERLLLAVDEINAAGGILGKKIQLEFVDTGSDPGNARAAIQRALDDKPIAIFGPIYSGSVNATLQLTNEAEMPQIIGGEAADLTAQGSKYLFRTSFGQNVSMPKIANYHARRAQGEDRSRSSG